MDLYKILFVCLGNICRSPSAEAVMKHIIQKNGLEDKYVIDSAGIINSHAGSQADRRMRDHASKRGYQLTSISRQVIQKDFEEFDLIIGMDDQNIADLNNIAPNNEAAKKIRKMTNYCTDNHFSEVPDPYYGGSQGFEIVLDILEDATQGLLAHTEKTTT